MVKATNRGYRNKRVNVANFWWPPGTTIEVPLLWARHYFTAADIDVEITSKDIAAVSKLNTANVAGLATILGCKSTKKDLVKTLQNWGKPTPPESNTTTTKSKRSSKKKA